MSGLGTAGPSRRNAIFYQHDADLLALAAQLSLEDVEQMERDHQRGTRDSHRISDAELALSLFTQEARNSIMFNNDRALARTLQEAERRNAVGAPLAPPARRRAVAGGVPPPVPPPPPLESASSSGPSFLSQMFGWISSFVSPSSQPSSQPRLTGHVCVICQDPIRGPEVYTPCRHYYDQGCITDLFRSAITDESLFPPRCCRQNIPIMSVRFLLTPDLLAQFEKKEQEYRTPKRVYCANPRCSRFLGPVAEGWSKKVYLCHAQECDTRTCSGCRRQITVTTLSSYAGLSYVPPHVCQPDPEDARVLALGREAQWAQCPSCDQMIELAFGCFHMTCLCKFEFCYLCRARWKSCSCPQWDENRLVNAAEARVDARFADRPRRPAHGAAAAPLPPPPRHPARVQPPVRPLEVAQVQPQPRPVAAPPLPRPALPVHPPPVPASLLRTPLPLATPIRPHRSAQVSGFEHTTREQASHQAALQRLRMNYLNNLRGSAEAATLNPASGGGGAFADLVAKAAAVRPTSIVTSTSNSVQAGPSGSRKPSATETNALVGGLLNENTDKNRSVVEGKGKSREDGRTSHENQGNHLTENQVKSWHSLFPPPDPKFNDSKSKSRENKGKNRADEVDLWRSNLPLSSRPPKDNNSNASQNKDKNRARSNLPLPSESLGDNKSNAIQKTGKNRADEAESWRTNLPLLSGSLDDSKGSTSRNKGKNWDDKIESRNSSDSLPSLSSSSSVASPACSSSPPTSPIRATNQNQKQAEAFNNVFRQIDQHRSELGVTVMRSPWDVSELSQREERPAVRLPPKRSKNVANAVPSGQSEKARGKRPARRPAIPAVQSSSSATPAGSNTVVKGGKQKVHGSEQRKHGRETTGPKNRHRPPAKDEPQFAETRAQLIREYIASIRLNEDCSHQQWRTERPGGQCEMCHRDFRLYIFICTECQTSACNRCRRNRL